MRSEPSEPANPARVAADVPQHISQNIDSLIAFYRREEDKRTDSDRRLASLGRLVGSPAYLLTLVGFVGAWILYNALAPRVGWSRFDPPPFFWLQGLLALAALLTTTVVLITQNRQGKFETQRLNLDLQVNLATEQKTTKLIHLLEELRRDLPMVRDRHDAVATALQTPTDPAKVLAALDDPEAQPPP
jgi:uncharacterized membrane protein